MALENQGFEVHLKGFKTRAQAEAFVNWYSNSGEQEASNDFECRKEEGTIDVDFMPIDNRCTWPLNEGNVINVQLTMMDSSSEG